MSEDGRRRSISPPYPRLYVSVAQVAEAKRSERSEPGPGPAPACRFPRVLVTRRLASFRSVTAALQERNCGAQQIAWAIVQAYRVSIGGMQGLSLELYGSVSHHSYLVRVGPTHRSIEHAICRVGRSDRRAGAASSFLVYRYSNGCECGFQFFALPFRHEMSRLGIPADVARQVSHPRCSEKVQIKPENFIGPGD